MSDQSEPVNEIEVEFGPVDGPRLEKYLARTCTGYGLLLLLSFLSPFLVPLMVRFLDPVAIPGVFADPESARFFYRILLFGAIMGVVSFIMTSQRSYGIAIRMFNRGMAEDERRHRAIVAPRREEPFVVPDFVAVTGLHPRMVNLHAKANLLIILSVVVIVFGQLAADDGPTTAVKWILALGLVVEGGGSVGTIVICGDGSAAMNPEKRSGPVDRKGVPELRLIPLDIAP